jgi:cyclohexa-1,5-dienecarbonyl-CoA hydratase
MADPADGRNDVVLHEQDGRIGYITINRPPLNILNIAAFDRMAAALIDLTERGQVDVVVIRSAGERAFSAGADVSEHLPEMAPLMLKSFHRVARLLWSMEAVSVAAVQGLALGGGMELALCCDIVVASENSEFGQPEIQVGAFPPIAAAALPAQVGRQVAADLVLTGRRVSGFEALALGMVSRLASPGGFEEELGGVLVSLTRNSGPVMRRAVKALRARQAASFLEALEANESMYVNDLLALPDAREGVEAFLAKRKPRWPSRPKETPER